MDGAQDMGGVKGFGPVEPEPDEPVFHAEWERRAFALTLAMSRPGGWNIDMSRFARENRPHADYLSKSYYQIWLAGLERLMVERRLVSAAGDRAGPLAAAAEAGREDAEQRTTSRRCCIGAVRPSAIPLAPALFAIGDRVRMKNINPPTHTRLPRYVRGRVGTIELLHGCHVFPDTNSLGQGENPQWLYTVSFAGPELWGADADPTVKVSVDAWESYLETA